MINTLQELYTYDKSPMFSLYYDFNRHKASYLSANLTGYATVSNELFDEVITLCPNGTGSISKSKLLKYILNKRNNKLSKIC